VKQACVDASSEGQTLRDAGKLRAARDRFVSCARDECPAIVRKYCVEWLGEVDKRVPTVIFRAQSADGEDLAGAQLVVDGAPQPLGFGAALSLDPGEHLVRGERKGGPPAEDHVIVVEGEKGRIVTLRFPAIAHAPQLPSTSPPEPQPVSERHPRLTATSAVLGGVAIVGLASFAYFGVTAKSDLDHLRSTCAPTCASSDLAAVKNEALAADISLGVGVVALGVAFYAFFTHREAPATAGMIELRPRAGGGVVQIAARF
jgi:hypothetical protein